MTSHLLISSHYFTDENREVLESLLYFLSDMASYHEENQMTASNLAMCFAPSLFNIHNRYVFAWMYVSVILRETVKLHV